MWSPGLLEALAQAHAVSVLHRDIKPENIMLVGENAPKLLDFGLAGGYQKMGPMLRVTARLMEAATGSVAATEKLDGSIEQIFTMQDRLSEAAAHLLELQTPVSICSH